MSCLGLFFSKRGKVRSNAGNPPQIPGTDAAVLAAIFPFVACPRCARRRRTRRSVVTWTCFNLGREICSNSLCTSVVGARSSRRRLRRPAVPSFRSSPGWAVWPRTGQIALRASVPASRRKWLQIHGYWEVSVKTRFFGAIFFSECAESNREQRRVAPPRPTHLVRKSDAVLTREYNLRPALARRARWPRPSQALRTLRATARVFSATA